MNCKTCGYLKKWLYIWWHRRCADSLCAPLNSPQYRV